MFESQDKDKDKLLDEVRANLNAAITKVVDCQKIYNDVKQELREVSSRECGSKNRLNEAMQEYYRVIEQLTSLLPKDK